MIQFFAVLLISFSLICQEKNSGSLRVRFRVAFLRNIISIRPNSDGEEEWNHVVVLAGIHCVAR